MFTVIKYFGSDDIWSENIKEDKQPKDPDGYRYETFYTYPIDIPEYEYKKHHKSPENITQVAPGWYRIPGKPVTILIPENLIIPNNSNEGQKYSYTSQKNKEPYPSWEELLDKSVGSSYNNTFVSQSPSKIYSPQENTFQNIKPFTSPILHDNKLLQSELKIIEQAVIEKRKGLLEDFLQQNNILFDDIITELTHRLERQTKNNSNKYIQYLLNELSR